jgi:hypothetical protein
LSFGKPDLGFRSKNKTMRMDIKNGLRGIDIEEETMPKGIIVLDTEKVGEGLILSMRITFHAAVTAVKRHNNNRSTGTSASD